MTFPASLILTHGHKITLAPRHFFLIKTFFSWTKNLKTKNMYKVFVVWGEIIRLVGWFVYGGAGD